MKFSYLSSSAPSRNALASSQGAFSDTVQRSWHTGRLRGCFQIATFLVLLAVLSTGLQAAQRIVIPPPPIEEFSDEDDPHENSIWLNPPSGSPYRTRIPWGYDRPENAERSYPMIVIGHSDSYDYFTTEFRKRYPTFIVRFGTASVQAGETLSDAIDDAIQAGHRIDVNRIYLTGYSVTGSGGYNTIQGFLNRGKCFAAFIRIAGQSNHVLPEGAVDKIAISMHIGLQDSPQRIQVSRDLYAHLRDHSANASAVETILQEPHLGRTTWVLSMAGADIIRYSEYPEMGHTHPEPYADPGLYEWLMTRAIGSSSNAPPTLVSPGDQTVQAGETITLAVEASDPDDDAITLAATGGQP